jgi:hypothetical protein
MKVSTIVCLFIIIIWVSSPSYYMLFPKEDQFQKKFNKTRARLGVCEIIDTWKTNDYDKEIKFWFPDNFKDVNKLTSYKGFRGGKLVVCNNGKILKEIDYISNKLLNDLSTLTIEYYYNTNEFKYKIGSEANDKNGLKDVELTQFSADSILNIWEVFGCKFPALQ